MLIVYLFIALASICCACAALFGGFEGRWTGGLMMLTILAGRTVGAIDLELARSPSFKLWLDGALLLALIAIMLRSQRWWPIWLVGLQANAVIAHLAAVIVPTHTRSIYWGLQSFWGIPQMLVLVAGPLLDRAAALGARSKSAAMEKQHGRASARTRSGSDASR